MREGGTFEAKEKADREQGCVESCDRSRQLEDAQSSWYDARSESEDAAA